MTTMQKTRERRTETDPEIAEVKARNKTEVDVEDIDALLNEIDNVIEESGGLKEAEDRAAYREKLLGWAKNQKRLNPSWSEQEAFAQSLVQSVLPCQC